MLSKVALFFAVAAVVLGAAQGASLGCKSELGTDVDWFVMFKLPNGREYYYADSTVPSLKKSVNDLSSSSSAFWRTMVSGKKSGASSARMMYNDEDPDENKSSDSRAHAKGIFYAANDWSGFWIVHSVPRFPDAKTSSTTYPDYAIIYGQSFLCMSLTKSSEWKDLTSNLLISFPQVYDSNLPSWFTAVATSASDILGSRQPAVSEYQVVTFQGGVLTSFAKDNSWDSDLYSRLVAPTLKVSLVAETWMRPAMDPVCSLTYNVENVRSVKFPLDPSFDETQDHSKWAVAKTSRKPYVCIGDINRMISQRKRGGGTVCFLNNQLWSDLKAAIETQDLCS